MTGNRGYTSCLSESQPRGVDQKVTDSRSLTPPTGAVRKRKGREPRLPKLTFGVDLVGRRTGRPLFHAL